MRPTQVVSYIALVVLFVAVMPTASAETPPGRILFISANEEGEGGLFLMHGDGSNPTRIVSGQFEAYSWSPDGCRIVFFRGGDVVIIDADGSNEKRVAAASSTREPPRFSPDGNWILAGLEAVHLDGKTQIFLGGRGYGWSPDGSEILANSKEKIYAIDVQKATGSRPSPVGEGKVSYTADASRILLEPGSAEAPVWSPDGAKIAFTRLERTGKELEVHIYTMFPDGTNVAQLTSGSVSWRLAWSPDSSKIAFETMTERDITLEVMGADGTHRTVVGDQLMFPLMEDDIGLVRATWSPDGSKIAFTRMSVPLRELTPGGDMGFDIYTVSPDGSDLTRLTTGGRSLVPLWSPTASCEDPLP